MLRKTRRILAAAAAFAVMATAPPAQAAICAPYDELTKYLSRTYKEEREAMGLTRAGQLVEVYVSESGSWTVLLTSPEGKACVLSAGEHWQGRLRPPGPAV